MPVGVEEAAQRVPYIIIILTHSKEVATDYRSRADNNFIIAN